MTKLNAGVDTIEALEMGSLLIDIQRSTSARAMADTFDSFWLAQLGKGSPPASDRSSMNHQKLIAALEASVGSDNIANICDTLGVSERQFRRLSSDLFGMSPKKLQNILRLQLA